MPIPFVLFAIFLTLKLCAVIDWSWWWVTCPLWAVPALFLSVFVGGWFAAFVALIAPRPWK